MIKTEYERVRRFLRPGERLATFFPHPNPGIRLYRVVTHGPDNHVAVCDETGECVGLKHEDLILWELDRPALGRALAAALGVPYDDEPTERLPCVGRIGYYQPLAGYRFPVYLAIPSVNINFPQVVVRLAMLQDGPMVLFTTTRQLLTQWEVDLLHRQKACLLPLDESVEIDPSGRLCLTLQARQRIEEFRETVLPSGQEDAAVSFFPTPAGATWSQVRIRLIDGHTASVSVGAARGVFNYVQMGMANRKSAAPSVQWELLQAFAACHGMLTWRSPAASPRNQKRRELLGRALREFFRIDGDPFLAVDDGWQAKFQVSDGN